MTKKMFLILRDYALMTIGALLCALSVNLFLVPNNVISGGVTGIAMILRTLVGTPVGIMYLLLNIPLFIVGWRYLGGRLFGARTIYATVVLALAIDWLAPYVTPVSRDPLLYTLYGGVLDGIGVGLVLRARGTTGGVDILGRLLERWHDLAPGQTMLVIDAAIFAGAALLYGPEKVLYALLVVFVSTRTIDLVLSGARVARQAIIISKQHDLIRQTIISDLRRGVTLLQGQGGYTGLERSVLLCAVSRSEISLLKALVARIDPDAFVIVGEVSEVIGEGFQASPEGVKLAALAAADGV